MSDPDLILRSRRTVVADRVMAAAVHVRQGKILRVADYNDVPAEALSAGERGPLVELEDKALLPGLVDTHVHINEPGRTEWEGFTTATRAAAAGGITTVVDMPLNSIPPVTSVGGLLTKAETMEGKVAVDLGLWGGAVPANARHLAPLLSAGALGMKCFLLESGVDEFPHVTPDDLEAAVASLQGTDAVLMVHAELAGPIERARPALAGMSPRSYARYLASRPPEAEDKAVSLLFELVKRYQTRVHIVHLSSAGALDTLRAARDLGLPLTAETAPHYLHFAAEEIPDGATEYKCAPPVRDGVNRERLWQGLKDGLIKMVVSDHSPCCPELKRQDTGDFDAAWGGIAGLQLSLPATWTEASARGHTLVELADWMARAPARHAGLDRTKGRIAPGLDADFVVFDPDASFRVEPERLEHRWKLTPYAGQVLKGVVHATFLRGQKIWERGIVLPAGGRWIQRPN